MKPALSIDSIPIRQQGDLFSLNDLHHASGGEEKHRPGYFLENAQTRALAAELETAGFPAVKTKGGRMTHAVSVPFAGVHLLAVMQGDCAFVAMRPIVEGMGLDWSKQLKKLKAHPVLARQLCTLRPNTDSAVFSTVGHRATVGSADGKAREMVCLPTATQCAITRKNHARMTATKSGPTSPPKTKPLRRLHDFQLN